MMFCVQSGPHKEMLDSIDHRQAAIVFLNKVLQQASPMLGDIISVKCVSPEEFFDTNNLLETLGERAKLKVAT